MGGGHNRFVTRPPRRDAQATFHLDGCLPLALSVLLSAEVWEAAGLREEEKRGGEWRGVERGGQRFANKRAR